MSSWPCRGGERYCKHNHNHKSSTKSHHWILPSSATSQNKFLHPLLFSSQCQFSQCSLSSQSNSKPKSGSTPLATPPHASSLSLSSRPRAPTRLLNLPRTMSTLHLPASQVLCTRVKSPAAYLSSDGAFQLRSLGNSSSTSIPIYYSWAIGLKMARSSRGWARIGIEKLWIDPTLSQGC